MRGHVVKLNIGELGIIRVSILQLAHMAVLRIETINTHTHTCTTIIHAPIRLRKRGRKTLTLEVEQGKELGGGGKKKDVCSWHGLEPDRKGERDKMPVRHKFVKIMGGKRY